jgi:protocatechuate 3,4-dioxygenase beta subunit
MKKLTRRTLVARGLGTLASRAFAVDRPQVDDGGGWFGSGNISCNNAGVPVSPRQGRLAKTTDFAQTATCQMSEDSFEGPYFMCVDHVGKDISGGRDGTPLTGAIKVQDANCTPIPNATVDIWACDARGHYAGYTASPDLPATTGDHVTPQTDDRFCRGVYATDADGIAEFDTIYPGYYAGRAIHIHFKLHINDTAYITNQALMPEDINARILAMPPYSAPRGTRRILNAEEGDFALFDITERDDRFLATLTLTVEG